MLDENYSRMLRVLYTHKDINNNSNTNTYSKTGGLFRFGYEQVNLFLASVLGHTRGETDFLKAYANHTMLTPLHAWHILWFLRSQFITAGRDPKNSTALLNARKLNYSFKILKFSDPSLLGMTSSRLQPHFRSRGLLWHMMIVVSFPHGRKTAPFDSAHGLRDPSSSKPYQTNNKILLTKND